MRSGAVLRMLGPLRMYDLHPHCHPKELTETKVTSPGPICVCAGSSAYIVGFFFFEISLKSQSVNKIEEEKP